MKIAFETISTSKRELLRAKEAKMQQIEERVTALAEILAQEKRYLTDCTEKSFQEQDNLYSAKENEVSQALTEMESVLQSADEACQNEEKSTFLSGVADKKRKVVKSLEVFQKLVLQPETTAEKEVEMCSVEDFRTFCHERNFLFTKSHPLKFHLERHPDLSGIAMCEPSTVTVYVLLCNHNHVRTQTSKRLIDNACSRDDAIIMATKSPRGRCY